MKTIIAACSCACVLARGGGGGGGGFFLIKRTRNYIIGATTGRADRRVSESSFCDLSLRCAMAPVDVHARSTCALLTQMTTFSTHRVNKMSEDAVCTAVTK